MRYLPVLAVAALAIPAASASAQVTDAKSYVKMAGADDKFEIDSSKLVLTSTKDPTVRQFANKMIADHTDSTNKVKMAAKSAGMMLAPPMLTAMQKSDMAKLRAAHGTARDKLYWKQQVTSHQMALQLHQTYASSGDKPALQSTAGQIAPVVQSHIDMLQQDGAMSAM